MRLNSSALLRQRLCRLRTTGNTNPSMNSFICDELGPRCFKSRTVSLALWSANALPIVESPETSSTPGLYTAAVSRLFLRIFSARRFRIVYPCSSEKGRACAGAILSGLRRFCVEVYEARISSLSTSSDSTTHESNIKSQRH